MVASPLISAPVQPGSTRRNGFDVLRLAAAVAVLVSHSFVLTGGNEPGIGRQSLGTIAVIVFFAISGFLITQSWVLEPRIGRFVVKRALRILPALLAVLLLSAFVIGPLLTSLSEGSYLTDSQTWKYVGANALMHPTYVLPGVFTHNPFPNTVNGSLWTLQHEIRCYLLIAAVGVVGLVRDRRVTTVALAVIVVVAAAAEGHGPRVLGDPGLLRAFAFAGLLYLWRDRVPWSPLAAIAMIAVWVATRTTDVGVWAATLALPYATILIAYMLPGGWSRLTRRGDISYGIYLWAFPIQQLIASAWHDITLIELMALSLPLTVAAGALSWILVEQPALALKRRLLGGAAKTRESAVAAPVAAPATPPREPAVATTGA